MQTVPFSYEGQTFDFSWELEPGELIKVTCFHDVYKCAFGDFTKKFPFFGYMIMEGRKQRPEFFDAMKAGMLKFDKKNRSERP